MNKLITTFIAGIAVAFLIAPVAFAQTPDGITPAEETVCDPLREDGVTKGLFGLCVAFCEAQDYADLSDPITETELGALGAAAPSGKILANYNKRKQDTDPAMPCILVEEPCPCWSDLELASIDGLIGGTSSQIFECSVSTPAQVHEFRESNIPIAGSIQRARSNLISLDEIDGFCQYINNQPTKQILRLLSVQARTLTIDQSLQCRAEVEAACTFWGFP